MGIFAKIKRGISGRAVPPVPVREWAGRLGSLVDKLTPLPGDAEKEFLSIGSSLQGFTVRARELSEMSTNVARLTSGDEIGAATDRLREQLDKLLRYLSSSEKESDVGMKKLQYILGITEGFDVICGGFTRIARNLQFLSVSTRVESARLDQHATGFDILSDDVKRLAGLIDAKSASIMGNANTLTILVKNAISRTLELLSIQQGSAVSMLRDAQSSLELLTDLNGKSSGVSDQIAKCSSDIYKNIGEVVTSMQFHDITRQEMEHVGKALERLREQLEEFEVNNGGVGDDQQRDLAWLAGDVCDARSSQLFQTRDALVSAVNCVIDNLRGISGNIKGMVEKTLALSGSTHQSGSSLLSQVEAGIMTVIQSLRENVERGKEIAASVSSAVNGMVEFVREIEEIGIEIKLIALNAQTKAKRTGEDGRALGAIAEGIQELAVEAGMHTAVVLEKLRTIAAEARMFHGDADASGNDRGTEAGVMAGTLEGLLDTIHRTNAEFAALLKRITEDGRTLGEEIDTLSRQTVFHEEMGIAIDGIADELVEVAAQSRELAPSFAGEQGGRTTEKAVNNEYLAVDNENLPPSVTCHLPAASVNKQEEDSGGNVELF